jgi:hypothetical protein
MPMRRIPRCRRWFEHAVTVKAVEQDLHGNQYIRHGSPQQRAPHGGHLKFQDHSCQKYLHLTPNAGATPQGLL